MEFSYLMVVEGGFIAGVQAQCLASTFDSDATTPQVFTNGVGFVGLTLDIIGTSLGVVHVIYLQQAIRSSQQLTHSLSVEPLKKKIQKLQRAQKSYEEIIEFIRRHQKKIDFLPSLSFARSQVFLGHNVAPPFLSDLPLVAMSLGIACLLTSVICFAAYSQPRVPSAVYLVVMTFRNKTSEFFLSSVCSITQEHRLSR
jgi:hypothetical protein